MCPSTARTPRAPGSSPPPPNSRSRAIRPSGRHGGCETSASRSIPCRCPPASCRSPIDDDITAISARSEWAPEFAIYDLESTDELFAAEPDDYPDDVENYLWTWTDRDNGVLRSRMFAVGLGVPEDEATGAAAVRITDYLSRDLTIVQGKGSVIQTQWSPDGWVRVAGRVVNDGIKQID